MSRTLGILCAGALLMAAAGCTLDSLFVSITGSGNRKEETVAMSVSQVSASIRASLGGKFGLLVDESRDGEEVWLKGQTKNGKKFAFILQRQKSDSGERTIIAFEGEKEAQELLWQAIINIAIYGPADAQPQQRPQGAAAPATSPAQMPFSSGFQR
jgi:hypothetical protein